MTTRDKAQKAVKQPVITQAELNKIEEYNQERKKTGMYKPWVTVRQSHTYGQGHILTSHKAKHTIHLLSRGELGAFLELEQKKDVIAIFEQWPLPIADTMEIAERLNIVHPGNYKERDKHNRKVPAKTMTTDLVTIAMGSERNQSINPYSFKYASALDESETSPRVVKRTKDKIAIEAEYWHGQGASLGLILDTALDKNKSYNFDFLRDCFNYPEYCDPQSVAYLSALTQFKHSIKNNHSWTLKQHIESISEEVGIDDFHAQCIFQHAAYLEHLSLDLSQKIETYKPLPLEYTNNPYAY